MTRTLFRYSVAAGVLMLALSPLHANAAGFYLQENSVSGLGSAFAGSASSIDDASTIWFNPAGLTDLDGRQVSAGVQLLVPKSKLTDNGSTILGAPIPGDDGGNPYKPTPLPNLYGAMPLTEDNKVWAGLGFNAPFGLSSDYENSSFIRYDSTYTALQVFNLSGVMAYEVSPMLSIGGGLDVQYADATLRLAVNGGGPDTYTEVTGDDVSVGYNLGLKFKPLETTEVGLTYRSSVNHELDGRFRIMGTSGVITPVNAPGSADLDLPDIAAVGVTHEIIPGVRGMANVTWYGWNSFDEIAVILDSGVNAATIEQNYDNTVGFAIGGEYDLNDAWTLRAGYQYDPTPTRDNFRTSRTPDGDRNWIAAGATYKWKDNMSFDFGAAYIFIDEENINLTRNGGAVTYDATTEGNVAIISTALNYKF